MMIEELRFVLLLLLLINIIAFFSYYRDKKKAENNAWRTPERILLIWGLAGPFGAYLAMRMFRHKTQKTRFLLVPAFLVIQLVLITYCMAVWPL
ncbi:MAG: DUF1294 domain-containing protein [Methanoregulaceae archaeon]|jgi:uncharacterized membrane protein YsdA (DUF1294 family)|nr:DUF1294 domain-containing protein [Methanoregulaceae archaeon]